MSEDRSSNEQKSWFNKLTQAFAHEPRNRQELLEVLREAHQNKLLDSEALAIVEGAIQVADLHHVLDRRLCILNCIPRNTAPVRLLYDHLPECSRGRDYSAIQRDHCTDVTDKHITHRLHLNLTSETREA